MRRTLPKVAATRATAPFSMVSISCKCIGGDDDGVIYFGERLDFNGLAHPRGKLVSVLNAGVGDGLSIVERGRQHKGRGALLRGEPHVAGRQGEAVRFTDCRDGDDLGRDVQIAGKRALMI